jgi:hypothetical protein
MDMPLTTYIEPEAVLRAWLSPAPAYHAPAPKPTPIQLPESWTVVTTTSGTNAWTGDVALVADGSYTCDLVQVVKIEARTPAYFYVR